MPPPFSTTAVDLLLKSCTRKMRLPMMPHTSDLFFRQWADKFHKADRITFKVGSSRPGSTADPMGVSTKDLADTDMAAIIKTDTTLDLLTPLHWWQVPVGEWALFSTYARQVMTIE